SWPRWLVMGVIAVSLLWILKAASLQEYLLMRGRRIRGLDVAAWFLTWPGLNTREFFSATPPGDTPATSEWITSALTTLLGIVLLAVVAPWVANFHEWLGGWMAVAGLLFIVHFGVISLLAHAWRCAGRNVRPIMDAPHRATTVAEFWGRRWN